MVSGFFADFRAKKRMILVKVILLPASQLLYESRAYEGLPNDVQGSKSKYCVEQEFLPPSSLQLVYHMHRKKQNEEISGD